MIGSIVNLTQLSSLEDLSAKTKEIPTLQPINQVYYDSNTTHIGRFDSELCS